MGTRIMVNMAKVDAVEVADKTGLPTEDVERVVGQIITDKNNNRRQLKPPPPEGGISIRAAGRKYNLAPRTISGWVQKDFVPVLLRTKNWLYVDEAKLAEVVEQYRENPGQGKRTISVGTS